MNRLQKKCMRVGHTLSPMGRSPSGVGLFRCRRCGVSGRAIIKEKPFNDKRNFRRSDPRYKEYQKHLKEQIFAH